MRLFKPILKPSDAEGHILSYTPKPILQKVATKAQAKSFDPEQILAPESSFAMDSLQLETTGHGEIERRNFADRMEAAVLEKLKAVEEKAYAESYALGLEEGRAKAYADTTADIKACMAKIENIVTVVTEIKKKLLVENEAHIVKLVLHLAKTLALREMKTDPSVIVDVVKKALENAQAEEEIRIRLNPEDIQFIESIKAQAGNPFERIAKLKVENGENITRGGCVIETNYGVIDASIEKRIEKLAEILDSRTPKNQEAE